MTNHNELHSLRTTAKRVARARRIAHHEALDLIARKLQQPHWNALTAAWDKGWRPEPEAVEALASVENLEGLRPRAGKGEAHHTCRLDGFPRSSAP